MITKSELMQIDAVIEEAVATMKPIVAKLKKTGSKADCFALSAYGDLGQAHHKINKAIKV